MLESHQSSWQKRGHIMDYMGYSPRFYAVDHAMGHGPATSTPSDLARCTSATKLRACSVERSSSRRSWAVSASTYGTVRCIVLYSMALRTALLTARHRTVASPPATASSSTVNWDSTDPLLPLARRRAEVSNCLLMLQNDALNTALPSTTHSL